MLRCVFRLGPKGVWARWVCEYFSCTYKSKKAVRMRCLQAGAGSIGQLEAVFGL
jgi:hypothetical protein